MSMDTREAGRGVVVCPQVPAAEVGVSILNNGGNAIDAAIATGMVQGVIDPPMAGIGGFGVMLYYSADQQQVFGIDFPARAGRLVTPDQWHHLEIRALDDQYGYAVEGLVNDIGYQSVGVPGTVAGFGLAHELWGTMPWSELLQPAIVTAADGFRIPKSVHDFWLEPVGSGRASGFERMTATPPCRDIFAPSGSLLDIGELCVQAELAGTLRRIAEAGPRDFYEGEIAHVIAGDFGANGGHITLDDLRSYRALRFDPLVTSYRNYTVYGAPPPSGGIMVAQMLQIIGRHDLRNLGFGTVETLRILIEAMRYAVLTRARLGADPDFVDIDVLRLLSDAANENVREVSNAGRRLLSAESPNTTHLIIVDQSGNIASVTHSLGYGSGAVTKGLGFIYNNYMNVFNPRAGYADSMAPGKRRASGMAPTIVTDALGDPVLAVGAPGATRITTAVLHSIVNSLDFEMSPWEAVAAPRVDCQGGTAEIEGRFPSSVAETLRAQGLTVNLRNANYDPYFARAQLAALVGGLWVGASDPRRDGGTALYTE